MTTQLLNVSNGRIAYQVDGAGPMLFLVGAPVGIAGFEPLASRLADRYTVVRHDPRGIGGSPIDGDTAPEPSLLADDLACLIEEIASGPATVFGASGGAVTGLDLVARRPELVRLLVAHEPPAFTLLDDDGALLERMDVAFGMAERDPHGAAQLFADLSEAMHSTRTLLPRPERIVLPPTSAAEQERNRYFLGRMAPATAHYQPALDAIDRDKLVVAAGECSVGQPAWRASHALAERVAAPLVHAPGNHLGMALVPDDFASWLRALLVGRGDQSAVR